MKRVLVLLIEGFEDIEMITPVDLLRRAGAEVVLASLGPGIHLTSSLHVTLHADAMLSDALASGPFDLLMIPGGPGVKALRADGRAAEIAKDFAQSARPVAAICAAPTVLADAGLLEGRRYTAHDSTYGELKQALADQRVVQDGGIITSRGAGTALDFGLALVTRLYGQEKADEIARRIMA
ncbi:DJ-1 family glyoxalase III [Prosthecobacter sp.]|uniref:DJ-1 family glyoxalase III n=1 Tax=Prosthecobacter sp. TaxID=1965333 RepID=UPI0037834F0D